MELVKGTGTLSAAQKTQIMDFLSAKQESTEVVEQFNLHLSLTSKMATKWGALVGIYIDKEIHIYKNTSLQPIGRIPITYNLIERCKSSFNFVVDVKETKEMVRVCVAFKSFATLIHPLVSPASTATSTVDDGASQEQITQE